MQQNKEQNKILTCTLFKLVACSMIRANISSFRNGLSAAAPREKKCANVSWRSSSESSAEWSLERPGRTLSESRRDVPRTIKSVHALNLKQICKNRKWMRLLNNITINENKNSIKDKQLKNEPHSVSTHATCITVLWRTPNPPHDSAPKGISVAQVGFGSRWGMLLPDTFCHGSGDFPQRLRALGTQAPS